MNETRPPVRPPKQGRSRATLARLLATARDMLADAEWRDLSVTELCKRASSSVGSFYARFEGKDALLERLATEAHSELAKVVAWCAADGRRRGLPLPSRLRQLAAALFRFVDRHGGVLRALVAEGRPPPWSDPSVHRTLAEILSDEDTPAEKRAEAVAILLATCAARAEDSRGETVPGHEALAHMLALYLTKL